MRKDQNDALCPNYIKAEAGDIKIDGNDLAETWKSYFDSLLNQEYSKEFQATDVIKGPVDCIRVNEQRKVMMSLKDGKAAGLSRVTEDMFKCAGWAGLNMSVSSLQNIMKAESVPTQCQYHSSTI